MGLLASFGLLGTFAANLASAQYPTPPSRNNMPPVVSPWLSMSNQGLPPALNYFNIVRPQFEFRNAIGQLQSQTSAEQEAIDVLRQPKLPTTGHGVGFQTQSKYFMTIRRPGASFGGAGGGMGQMANRPQPQMPTPGGMPAMGTTGIGSPFGR